MAEVDIIFQAAPAKPRSEFDINSLMAKYRDARATDWTIPEAFLCLLLSAAVADGNFSQEELTEIHALARRSRVLKTLDADGLAKLNTVVRERMKERPQGLREACVSLPHDMRLPVFAHCVDIVLADGELMQPEAEFLNRVTAFMELDTNTAQRVMEVLLIKNSF